LRPGGHGCSVAQSAERWFGVRLASDLAEAALRSELAALDSAALRGRAKKAFARRGLAALKQGVAAVKGVEAFQLGVAPPKAAAGQAEAQEAELHAAEGSDDPQATIVDMIVAATSFETAPWYLTAVRADLMREEQPPPGCSSHRPWTLAIVRPAPRPAWGSVDLFTVEGDAGTRPHASFQDACLDPRDAAACLAELAVELGQRPELCQVMPMSLGRWTFSSACALCDGLAGPATQSVLAPVPGRFPTAVVESCLEVPEGGAGGSRRLGLVPGRKR
jgi:hypothetical protein